MVASCIFVELQPFFRCFISFATQKPGCQRAPSDCAPFPAFWLMRMFCLLTFTNSDWLSASNTPHNAFQAVWLRSSSETFHHVFLCPPQMSISFQLSSKDDAWAIVTSPAIAATRLPSRAPWRLSAGQFYRFLTVRRIYRNMLRNFSSSIMHPIMRVAPQFLLTDQYLTLAMALESSS